MDENSLNPVLTFDLGLAVAVDCLDDLELTYRVEWPLNIVLTGSNMADYVRLASFMLQIKRMVWVLKDVWQRLKKEGTLSTVLFFNGFCLIS